MPPHTHRGPCRIPSARSSSFILSTHSRRARSHYPAVNIAHLSLHRPTLLEFFHKTKCIAAGAKARRREHLQTSRRFYFLPERNHSQKKCLLLAGCIRRNMTQPVCPRVRFLSLCNTRAAQGDVEDVCRRDPLQMQYFSPRQVRELWRTPSAKLIAPVEGK